MKITTISTPDGPFTLLAENGVVLASGWTPDPNAVLARLHPAPKEAEPVGPEDPEVAGPVAAALAYYTGETAAIDTVPVRQNGSAWRMAGWRKLREIPAGEPVSYADFAKALGNPRAVRAAASVCSSNAPALFVPCHRVLRGDGSMGGFAWGMDVKRSLLEREAAGGALF